MKKIAVGYLAINLWAVTAFAQVNSGLLTPLTAVAAMRERLPVEKVYLQLDKPYYTLGDTLRFKAYLAKADFLKPSTKSSLLYVELDDNTNKCVKRILVPLSLGVSWGDIALADKDFTEGSYTLRAYTNWMLNFGEDYVFKKNIYIAALSGSALVKAAFKARGNKIQGNLQFTGLDKSPLRLKDMELRVMNGRHNLIRDKATTGVDGSMDINFDIPDKTPMKNLYIQATETVKGEEKHQTLNIPISLSRSENIDLQFMPEGGNLVSGIAAKIGFKAISEDGNGIQISGGVYDSKQQQVASFTSAHKGMGSFEFTPQAGESYSAKITLPAGVTKTYPLPAVNPAGTTLRINPKGKDSLEVIITTSPTLTTSPAVTTPYYLIVQTRGVICYSAVVNFKGAAIKKIIPKDIFPSGIARFSLLNATDQPVNERIVYIDQDDNLRLSIATNKSKYTTRDSVALTIEVKDRAGKPVQGAFSLAVTDDSQVKKDSTDINILNNLLLTSDLKGTVEEPGYYFENKTPQKATDLDNLLLTQGWVGYDWKQLFDKQLQQPEPKYPAEHEFLVQGKVTNVLNKPVEGSEVLLFSRKPEMVVNSVTDKQGNFTFKGLFPVDTAEFKIQARNKNGKSFNVGIEMLNEFKPPAFSSANLMAPWYVNTDTLLLNNSHTRSAQLKAEADYRGEGHQLKEVKITDKKIVKGSHNLNGPGEADQILDEQDMLKAGKLTLRQLFQQKIKGFNESAFLYPPDRLGHMHYTDPRYRISYKINEKEIRFVFDGQELDYLYYPSNINVPGPQSQKAPAFSILSYERKQFIDSYLDYFTAEDFVGMEVMFNIRYSDEYVTDFISMDEMRILDKEFRSPVDKYVYVEITTRAGKGPMMKGTPGTYLYKPLPFSLPKQFYSPKYTAKNVNTAPGTDMRSTIYWAPQVITDKNGKATISFFSADNPADYTLIMEGTDANGNLGYEQSKLKITKPVGAR